MFEKLAGVSIHGRCFSTPKSLKFFPKAETRLALVYGPNGSGKSTITRAFKTLITNEDSELRVKAIDREGKEIRVQTPLVSIFNEEYVDSNVKIDDAGLGSIVLLGEQVELQNEIDAAEERTRVESEKLEAFRVDMERYLDSSNPLSPDHHWERIKAILKSTSGWAKNDSEIKGRRQNSSVNDAIAKEICTITVTESLEQLHQEFARKKALLEKTETPNPAFTRVIRRITISHNIEEQLIALLSVKLEEPFLSDREKMILAMVQGGYQRSIENSHDFFSSTNGSVCPYCFQKVTDEYREGLLVSIRRVLNKDVDQHKEQLLSFRIDEISDVYEQYTGLDEEIISAIHKAIEEYNRIVALYKTAISEKLQNIYTPIIQDNLGLQSKLDEINGLLQGLEAKRIAFIQMVNKREDINNELLTINKQIAYYHCREEYAVFQNQEKEKNKIITAYQQQERKQARVQGYLLELRQRKENLALAIECINESLSYVFFSKNRLTIELRDDKYYLKSRGYDVKPKNVSQGERNIIALCYFFIQIAANRELSKRYDQEQLLVIDDPVSSFDFENKVGIISLLRREIKKVVFGNSNSKVLLLTHDLPTAFDVKKHLKRFRMLQKKKTE